MKNIASKPVHRYDSGSIDLAAECLAAECLVHIYVNTKHVTSLLASPENLDELVRGHLQTEYALHHHKTEFETHIKANEEEFIVEVTTDTELHLASRNTIVTTSCGACEQDQLSALIEQTPSVSNPSRQISIEALIRSLNEMRNHQPGFGQTGGMHAAGLYFDEEQELLVREDIGRHNAVDKVIGAMSSISKSAPHALLLSGRCGWDIVSKAAKLDIPIIASIGAASTLAAETARASNMTLVSFAKSNRAVLIGPVEGRIERNH